MNTIVVVMDLSTMSLFSTAYAMLVVTGSSLLNPFTDLGIADVSIDGTVMNSNRHPALSSGYLPTNREASTAQCAAVS